MTQSTKTPELFVEKLVHGELNEEAARQVRQRLADEGGEARIDALKKSNEDILSEYAPRQLAASIRARHDLARQRQRKSALMVMLPVSAAIATAAVLMFVVIPLNLKDAPLGGSGPADAWPMDEPGGYVGIKGDPILNIGKRTDDEPTWLNSGETVHNGDELQIRYNTGRARSLVICSVDGRGSVTLHFPETEDKSAAVAPQTVTTLPYSYTLDDAPAFERFILVWSESDDPVSASEVLDAVKKMSDSQTNKPALRPSLKFKDITLKK